MVTEEKVRLSGAQFSTRVLRSGSGSPVLLLHGSPDSAGEWAARLAMKTFRRRLRPL